MTMIAAAYYLVLALVYGRRGWPSGWATVAICVLFSLGLNALFLGIIGEYLWIGYISRVRTALLR